MVYKVKNWEEFQHYKNKKKGSVLPWIKLYHKLMNDLEWHKLSGDSAKGLIMLWLVAGEQDGLLPGIEELSFRLRVSEQKANALLSTLSHWIYTDHIETLDKLYANSPQDKDKDKDKEKIYVGSDKPNPTPEHLFKLWNDRAHPNLPRVQGLSDKRRSKCKIRLSEHPEANYWALLIEKINASEFLRGDTNGWKCSFDFIIDNETNLLKIMEGKYDNGRKPAYAGTH